MELGLGEATTSSGFVPTKSEDGHRIMSSRDGRPRSADGRLGQLLAHAGEARGPLRRPARRLLGREPRQE
jgi:hypothetical protein